MTQDIAQGYTPIDLLRGSGSGRMKGEKRIFTGDEARAATAKIVIFDNKQLPGYSIIAAPSPLGHA